MTLDEFEKKHDLIYQNGEKIFRNVEVIASESNRTADIAHNSERIIADLDAEFESQTGLQGADVGFLFAATGLQLARIAILNELTRIEQAGKGKKEDALHKAQEKILGKFSNGGSVTDGQYYASMEHIITRPGVPYDATRYVSENLGLFKGGNHRLSTLGHDPILGLIFGTGNIMTNTITCVMKGPIHFPITNHVVYTSDYKDPQIGDYGRTTKMIKHMIDRTQEQPSALVASLIKQIIHIGTDLYTPVGISIPGANLVLSTSQVEKLTKYVSTGDLIKVGASAKLAELINTLIAALHMLMYDEGSGIDVDVYNVRTRKIIDYSNLIASGSNVLWVTGNVLAGNETAIKQLDIGGLMIMLKRLRSDAEYIRQIKEEFVLGGFDRMIQGEDLQLEEIVWD